jgi:hypothetical protein
MRKRLIWLGIGGALLIILYMCAAWLLLQVCPKSFFGLLAFAATAIALRVIVLMLGEIAVGLRNVVCFLRDTFAIWQNIRSIRELNRKWKLARESEKDNFLADSGGDFDNIAPIIPKNRIEDYNAKDNSEDCNFGSEDKDDDWWRRC